MSSDDKPVVKSKPGPKPKTKIPVEPIQQRIFSENKKIFHDLYKLLVAKMYKNLSWQAIPHDEYTAIEHCHFFHTFDSSGREQIHSTSVGGHFHVIKVEHQPNGAPPKVICESGPMKSVRKKNKRTHKFEKIIVPVNEVDTHTHEVLYLQSNQVAVRKVNEEAAKVIGANALLGTKPAGLEMKGA